MILRELAPEQAAEGALVVMGNPLGSSCASTVDGLSGRYEPYAQEIIDSLGRVGIQAGALLFDRLSWDEVRVRPYFMGLPKALDPSDYVRKCAEDATALNARIEDVGPRGVVGFGASAAASAFLDMLQTENLAAPTVLALFDPPEMKQRTVLPRTRMIAGWLTHQLTRKIHNADEGLDYDPLEHTGPAPVSGLEDMAVFGTVWAATDSARQVLQRIARGKLGPGMRTRLTIPGNTFTQSSAAAERLRDELHGSARVSGADIRVVVRNELYHSFTDNPANCGRLVLAAVMNDLDWQKIMCGRHV